MLSLANKIFDRIEEIWERPSSNKIMASLLLLLYAGVLVIIEANRRNLLPQEFANIFPNSHFYAVKAAFNMLLVWEVIGLVFSMAKSMSESVGKQFEILSLILLRDSFKELIYLGEPIQWQDLSAPIINILLDASGAILIFFLLAIYYKIQKHFPITNKSERQFRFIAAKKLISLILLAIFLATGAYHSLSNILLGESHLFFDTFYTILIFSDIFIVLISLRYCSNYYNVFRNSGFAVATLIIRLALTAPSYFKAVLGVAAIGYAIALTLTYNYHMSRNSAVKL